MKGEWTKEMELGRRSKAAIEARAPPTKIKRDQTTALMRAKKPVKKEPRIFS
jgi:hypothetical protein